MMNTAKENGPSWQTGFTRVRQKRSLVNGRNRVDLFHCQESGFGVRSREQFVPET
jgi:hypothetical protein